MSNLIDARNARTIHRKLKKKEYDDIITLSASSSGERLLDEGMVVDANGYPLFYITKGTLEKYLDALPDDYVGTINLGHMDFATFPILLGEFRKSDFHLVDIGDGRKGLDVDIHLDSENFIVKELRRASYDLGISAEFRYHVNEALSEEYGLEILDEIFIENFAIVGEAGNVNSSGIKLGGNKVTIQELSAAIDNSGNKNLDLKSLTDALDKLSVEEPKEEPAAEPAAELSEEPKEEQKELAEEPAEEKKDLAEEPAEEQKELSEEQKESEEEKIDLSAILTELKETVNGLKAEIETLKAERDEAKEKLSVKEKEEKDFIEKFKALSVISTKETPKPIEKKPVYTDGIGE